MGGDDSQKLLPRRGVHSSPGRKPPAQLTKSTISLILAVGLSRGAPWTLGLWPQLQPAWVIFGKHRWVNSGARRRAAFDHSAVAHKGHPLAAKALARLANLGAKMLRVLRIAAEDFRGDRRALFVAQQADDDLFLAFLAVAVVAVGAQGVVLAFQIAAGDVVEE